MKFREGAELFRWGPLPLKLVYSGTFFEVLQGKNLKKYGFIWADGMAIMHCRRFVWVQENDLLVKEAGKVFQEHILTAKFELYKEETRRAVADLNAYYASVSADTIARLPKAELATEARRFSDLVVAFELPTVAAEYGNYGSIHILRSKLRPYFQTESELEHAIVVLTTSTSMSYYQREEVELLNATDLIQHQQKYFWLKNSYDHVEVLPVTFFESRKKTIASDLAEMHEARVNAVRAEQTETVQHYALPESVTHIATRIVAAMEMQDERKKDMLKSHHYKHLFFQAFVSNGIKDAERYTIRELADIAAGKSAPDRTENFGFEYIQGEMREFGESEALEYWNAYAHDVVEAGVSECKGVVASKGAAVTGVARIVLDPEASSASSFEQGNILVAPMTSPEYVFLMKKAGAIVTDTGGLTSHAAIVSRELGVPCIVGTRTATQLFKDGDVVEVDASTGIARKVS